jgi:hypothetical protein
LSGTEINYKALKELRISDREQEVLQLLSSGLSNKEIANQLFIIESIAKSHVSSLNFGNNPKTFLIGQFNLQTMKSLLPLIALSILLLGSSISNAQCVINPASVYAFTYNGSDYELVRENKTWPEAANCAVISS